MDTDEYSSGERHLSDAIQVLEAHPDEFAEDLIRAENYLGILWANRSENKKAEEHLKRAEKLFGEYKKRTDEQLKKEPVLLTHPDFAERIAVTNALHTMTAFYLAQVYGALKQGDLSASYCHLTLNRQMESKDFDAREWVSNCAQLSVYYSSNSNYRQAEYCFRAASSILPDSDKEEDDEHLHATFHRMWGAMIATLMRASRDEMIQKQLSMIDPDSKGDYELKKFDQTLTRFTALSDIEDPDPIGVVETYEDARAFFQKGLGELSLAAKFFVLDGFVTDHIAVMQDMSGLYMCLAQYEEDFPRRCKMQKRRINLLEPIINELNVAYYKIPHRQLCEEVAGVFSSMVDLKRVIQRETGDDSMSKKINDLALKSVTYYQIFVKSFHNKDDPEKLEKLEDDDGIIYLNARLQVARQFTKIFAPDPPTFCAFQSRAVEEYKEIVRIAQEYNVKGFDEQLEMAKQMVTLLPLKMQQVTLLGTVSRDWLG
jgi:KIF-binding protein